jgi:hypothetical protein
VFRSLTFGTAITGDRTGTSSPKGPSAFAQPGTGSSLSDEHTEYRRVVYEDATALLRWDSNKIALWELNERLQRPQSVDPASGSVPTIPS